jgi:hypothetical protein
MIKREADLLFMQIRLQSQNLAIYVLITFCIHSNISFLILSSGGKARTILRIKRLTNSLRKELKPVNFVKRRYRINIDNTLSDSQLYIKT